MNASVQNIFVSGLGYLYMIGAGFNFAYTRKYGDKFYARFAERTWFTPASWFIQKFVLTNPGIFTTMLVLFQLFVGIALLTHGPYVGLGLLAGTAFCMYAVFVTSVPSAIVNLALAVLQFYLVTIR